MFGFVSILAYEYTQPVSIKYYSSNIDDKIVINAFENWQLKGVNYVRVETPEEANLILVKTKKLTDTKRYGESNCREIRINSKYKFSDKGLTNLISHEFGHYLFKEHNNDTLSIMNDKTSLLVKRVTKEDREVPFVKLRVLAEKLLGNIYQYSS